MDGLKRLFGLVLHILWLTRAAQLGNEPYYAASLAFCCSLSNEAVHISMATLNILGVIDDSVAPVIAEQILW